MKLPSKDVQELIQLLNKNNVEYIIVGAWAVAFYGWPRYTGDFDLFVNPTQANAIKLMKVLDDFGFSDIGIKQEDFLRDSFVIQLGVQPNRVDFLTTISGVAFSVAWDSKEIVTLGSLEMIFLSREHLIKNKQATGRSKDIADIEELRKIHGSD